MPERESCSVCGAPLNAPALRHRGVCLVMDDTHRASMDVYDRTHTCERHPR